MLNGFVPWSETKDPLACNTDDPVNFIEVSRDPVRTPFQWSNGKNAGTDLNIFYSTYLIWVECVPKFKGVDKIRAQFFHKHFVKYNVICYRQLNILSNHK